MHILIPILSLLILSSCQNSGKATDGLWYAAYTIKSGHPEDMSETTLIDFEGENAYIVQLRDMANADYRHMVIDTVKFDPSSSQLYLKDQVATILSFKDSLVISFDDLSQKVILRRMPLSAKDMTITKECFNGSFVIPDDNISGSIEFINDSVLLHTGSYGPTGPSPAVKWHLSNYKGYKFFVQHTHFAPAMFVTSCCSTGVELERPSVQRHKVMLTPTARSGNKNKLLGYWEEIERSSPLPPPPPNMSSEDLLYRIKINKDSLTFNQRRTTTTYKWDLTADGEEIYFINKLFTPSGTWKVNRITDSTLTLGIRSYPNDYVEVQLIKKRRNSR